MKRYRTEQHPLYDNLIVKFRNGSSILNPEKIPSVHSIMWDRSTLLSYLRTYKGSEKDGTYKGSEKEYVMAIIPGIEEQLKALEDAFAGYQLQRTDQGFAKPEDWPKELLDKKLQLEAKLDVAKEELAKIEGKLNSMREKEENADDSKVLKYGPVCTGRLFQGILVELDSQIIGKIDDTLIIRDKRSPYNGMAVADYRDLSRRWLAEIRRADAEILKQRQAKALSEGRPVPRSHSSISPVTRVKRELLPMWPVGIQNYLETIKTT
jgi:hypothetical protein